MGEWYVYILRSEKDGRFYIGCTSFLTARIEKHNCGGVDATKYRRPLRMEYSEAGPDKAAAMKREQYLKSLKSHTVIEDLIGSASRAPR